MPARTRKAVPRTTDGLDAALDIVGDEDVARRLLTKHSRLIDAQIRSERLEHRNKWALIAFRSVLALGALAVVIGFGWMVANARSDRGLVIEALSVPPDLAQRGLTGETLAAALADKLAEIDRTAQSFRSPETMTVNWGNDVKIQIPETGVSIGEVDAFLRRTLGHQTVIGGAAYRTPQGLNLTVRVGGSGAIDQAGKDVDLDAMLQKAAEGVFAKTQAYRYSKYLEFKGRGAEAMAVARELANTDDDPKERAWAWAQISNLLGYTDTRAAVAAGYHAIQEDPTNALAYLNTCIATGQLSHTGESDRLCDKAAELGADPAGGLSEVGINTSRTNLSFKPTLVGDFNKSLSEYMAIDGPLYPGIVRDKTAVRQAAAVALHDIRTARRLAPGLRGDVEISDSFASGSSVSNPQYDEAMQSGDYLHAAGLAQQVVDHLKTRPAVPGVVPLQLERDVYPNLAVALAAGGDVARAKAIVAPLPDDCDKCVVAKALVAAAGGDIAAARAGIDRVLRRGFNPVFGNSRLMQIELKTRHWPEALAAADSVVALGPNFADGHKARGDALRRLGRLDEAVAEYAKAAKIAPRWGRLYVDWGIAELKRGDKAAARREFDQAGREFLSNRDQKVLEGVRRLAGP